MSQKGETKTEQKSYKVEKGDTVDGIAKRNGITRTELLKANTKITNPNILKPKDILIIPGKKIIIDKAKEAEAKIKAEMSEQEWENKIFANLEQGAPFVTKLGTFDLKKKFTPWETPNVGIIKQAFANYMKTSGKEFTNVQKKYMLAYILATAKHETAQFSTLKEKTDGKKYNPPARVAKVLWNEPWEGPIYIGRGYVQITGENNYQVWSEKFFWKGNKTILTKYRSILLLNPDIAATILVKGMIEWSFTTIGLKSYLGKDSLDFAHARQTVNGMDRSSIISSIAKRYLANWNSPLEKVPAKK